MILVWSPAPAQILCMVCLLMPQFPLRSVRVLVILPQTEPAAHTCLLTVCEFLKYNSNKRRKEKHLQS